jgi:hypothetical protein
MLFRRLLSQVLKKTALPGSFTDLLKQDHIDRFTQRTSHRKCNGIFLPQQAVWQNPDGRFIPVQTPSFVFMEKGAVSLVPTISFRSESGCPKAGAAKDINTITFKRTLTSVVDAFIPFPLCLI